jgi:hypothetical protein
MEISTHTVTSIRSGLPGALRSNPDIESRLALLCIQYLPCTSGERLFSSLASCRNKSVPPALRVATHGPHYHTTLQNGGIAFRTLCFLIFLVFTPYVSLAFTSFKHDVLSPFGLQRILVSTHGCGRSVACIWRVLQVGCQHD